MEELKYLRREWKRLLAGILAIILILQNTCYPAYATEPEAQSSQVEVTAEANAQAAMEASEENVLPDKAAAPVSAKSGTQVSEGSSTGEIIIGSGEASEDDTVLAEEVSVEKITGEDTGKETITADEGGEQIAVEQTAEIEKAEKADNSIEESEKEIEEVEIIDAEDEECVEQTLYVTAEDGTKITVSGKLPVDAQVKAQAIDLTGQIVDINEYADSEDDAEHKKAPQNKETAEDYEGMYVIACAYDITIFDSQDREYKIDESVKVTIETPIIERLRLEDADMLHFEDGVDSAFDAIEIKEEDDEVISFDTDGFSLYAVGLKAPMMMKMMSLMSSPAPDPLADTDYYSIGKTFDINVPLNWDDAKVDSSYRPKSIPVTVYAKAIESGMEKTDLEVWSGTGTVKDNGKYMTLIGIPVYVLKGTGAVSDEKTIPAGVPEYAKYKIGDYYTPDNFYTIRVNNGDVANYITTVTDAAATISVDKNYLKWETSATNTISNKLKPLKKATFYVAWNDNNDADGTRPVETPTPELTWKLYYKDTDGVYKEVKENDARVISGAPDDPAHFEKTAIGNVWKYEFKNLADYEYAFMPALPSSKEQFYVASGMTQDSVEVGGTVVSRPILKEDTLGARVTYSYMKDFTGYVKWLDGENQEDVTGEAKPRILTKEALNSGMRLFRKIGNSAEEEVDPSEYSIVWDDASEYDYSKDTWKFSIPGLPQYSADGAPINYYATYNSAAPSPISSLTGNTAAASHNYDVTYNNAPYASEVDRIKSGGSMIAVLKDTKDSTAEVVFGKNWMDDGTPESRAVREEAISKGVTYYLWRYPVGPGETSAQKDGAPVCLNGSQLSYKFTGSEPAPIEITGEMFKSGFKFEKYDTKGYLYKYYVTEVMKADTYTATYYDAADNVRALGATEGGTVKNVRTEPVKVRTTKQWGKTYNKDYMTTTSKLVLQQYDTSRSEWVNARYADGTDKDTNGEVDPVPELVFSGFNVNDTSKTKTFDEANKFDAQGKPTTFRVIEESVTSSDSHITIDDLSDPVPYAGGWKQTYTIKNDKGGGKIEEVTYEMVSVQNSDGSWTVTNRQCGTTNLKVIKNWADIAKWITGAENKQYDVTFNILRYVDGEYDAAANAAGYYAQLHSTVKADDYAYDTKAELKKSAAVVGDEVKFAGGETLKEGTTDTYISNSGYVITGDKSSWSFPLITLPLLSDDGRLYTYEIVEEHTHAGSYSTIDYEQEGNKLDVKVTNSLPDESGEHIRIDVKKIWKDGNTKAERDDVYARTLRVKDYKQDTSFATPSTARIKEESVWKGYAYVDADNYKVDGLEHQWAITERISGREMYFPDTTAPYATPSEIIGYIPAEIASPDVAVSYKVTIRPTTASSVIGALSYEIENKRIGKEKVIVNKTWLDGNNGGLTRGSGYRLVLWEVDPETNTEIVPSIQTIEIDSSDPHYNDPTRTYEFDPVDLFDDDGVQRKFIVKEYLHIGGEWIQISELDTKANSKTGYILDVKAHDAVYTAETDSDGINWYTKTEEYDFTNSLAAYKKDGAKFYKIWHDEYNFEMGERPDIHYELYVDMHDGKGIQKYGTVFKDEPKPNEVWKSAGEGSAYYQVAEFSRLPMGDSKIVYDEVDPNVIVSYGHYYTYYVAEQLNNQSVDYERAYYEVGTAPGVKPAAVLSSAGMRHYDIDTGSNHSVDITAADGSKLIPENGVITNTARGRIQLGGLKIWRNLTAATMADPEKLPDLRLTFYRSSFHDKTHDHGVAKLVELDLEKKDVPRGKKSYLVTQDDYCDVDTEEYYKPDDGSKTRYFRLFDEYGAIYEYPYVEGIFVEGSAFSVDIPIYVMERVAGTSSLTNKYINDDDKNTRDIEVNKRWKNLTKSLFKDSSEYPQATFELYRYELPYGKIANDTVTVAGKKYINPVVDFETLKAAEPHIFDVVGDEAVLDTNYWEKVQVGDKSEWTVVCEPADTEGVDSTNKVTWENMPVYSPAGLAYVYAVVEKKISLKGFDITNSEYIAGINDSDHLTDGRSNWSLADNIVVYGLNPADFDFETGKLSDTASTEIRNTYNPQDRIMAIRGDKVFKDSVDTSFKHTGSNTIVDANYPFLDAYAASVSGERVAAGDITTTAKKNIHLEVYRTAQQQTEEAGNVIEYATISETEYDITWVKTGDKLWHYHIRFKDGHEQPVYAPNGCEYRYWVRETMVNDSIAKANYAIAIGKRGKLASEAVVCDEVNPYDNTVTGAVLTFAYSTDPDTTAHLENTLSGTIVADKFWDDTYNPHNLRGDEIMIQLQYKLDGDPDGAWADYGSERKLEKIHKAAADKDKYDPNDWKTTFTSLPSKAFNSSGNIVSVKWRVIETAIKDNGVYKKVIPDAPDTSRYKDSLTTEYNGNYSVLHATQKKPAEPATESNVPGDSFGPSKSMHQTVTNTLTAYTTLEVAKTWVDENNKYSLRPSKIEITLERSIDGGTTWDPVLDSNGDQVQKTITPVGGTWTYKFDALQRYYYDDVTAHDWVEVKYRVREEDTGVGAYDKTYNDNETRTADEGYRTDITNTLRRRTAVSGDISVEKFWNDGIARENHTSGVQVDLCSSNFKKGTGAPGSTMVSLYSGYSFADRRVTLSESAANKWTYTWSELPSHNMEGNEIKYSLKEVKTPDNYTTLYFVDYAGEENYHKVNQADIRSTAGVDKAMDVKIINSKYITATAAKTWDDQGNAYGKRPSSIVFRLERKKETEDDSKWTPVQKPEAPGSPVTVSVNAGATHDSDAAYYKNQTANVFKNANRKFENFDPDAVTWNKVGDNYEPQYVHYQYRWVESIPSSDKGYIYDAASTPSQYENYGGHTSFTNTQPTVDKSFTKSWLPDDNGYLLRPDSIVVKLQWSTDGGTTWSDVLKNNAVVTKSLPDSTDEWTAKFTGLPKYYNYAGSKLYQYRIVEMDDPTGTKDPSDSSTPYTDDGLIGAYKAKTQTDGGILNTLNTGSITVKKFWNDDKTAHPVITVDLYSNNYETGTDTTGVLNEANKISGTGGLIGTKIASKTISTGSSNEGSCVFTNLPVTNKTENEIIYYVKESYDDSDKYLTSYFVQRGASGGTAAYTEVAANKTSLKANVDGTVLFVNTLKTTAKGYKTWGDQDNKYQLRPAEITLTLERKSEKGAEVAWTKVSGYSTVTEDNNASQTKWQDDTAAVGTGLPAYVLKAAQDINNDGSIKDETDNPKVNPYTYRWHEEEKADGTQQAPQYTVTTGVTGNNESGFVSKTNNELETLTGVDLSKIWIDKDNKYLLRPQSIKVRLQRSTDKTHWDDVTIATPSGTAYCDDTLDASKAQSDPNIWTISYTGLPRYYDVSSSPKKEYYYRIVEFDGDTKVEDGERFGYYAAKYALATGSDTLYDTSNTIAFSPDADPIEVSKQWNNYDSTLSVPVTVKIYSPNYDRGDGLGVTPKPLDEYGAPLDLCSAVLESANSWKHTFDNLPMLNKTGDKIIYYVWETDTSEDHKTEYFIKTTGDYQLASPSDVKTSDGQPLGVKIFNTAYTTVSGYKLWDDQDNIYRDRPLNVTFTLQRIKKGEDRAVEANWATVSDAGGPVTIDISSNTYDPTAADYIAPDDYKAVCEALTKARAGKQPYMIAETVGSDVIYAEYEYRWHETVPDGYAMTEVTTGNAQDGYVTETTNKLMIRPVRVRIEWDDFGDRDMVRPEDVDVNLTLLDETDPANPVPVFTLSSKEMNLHPQGPVYTVYEGDKRIDYWEIEFKKMPIYVPGKAIKAKYSVHYGEVVTGVSYPEFWTLEENYNFDKSNVPTDPDYRQGTDREENYAEEGYGLLGYDTLVIRNVLVEPARDTLIIEKEIDKRDPDEVIPTTGFPIKVDITIGDKSRQHTLTKPFDGKYYLYDIEEVKAIKVDYTDQDLRDDAQLSPGTLPRVEKHSSNGFIYVPAGKKAVLLGVRNAFEFTTYETPFSLITAKNTGYIVEKVKYGDEEATSGNPAEHTRIEQGKDFELTGIANGTVGDKKLVTYVNQYPTCELRIDNITPENRQKAKSTGGFVKIFSQNSVKNSEDYQSLTTYPYREERIKVEFEPDAANDYTYDNWIRITWWNYGEDVNEPGHSVIVKDYAKKGTDGKLHPMSGSYVNGELNKYSFMEKIEKPAGEADNGKTDGKTDGQTTGKTDGQSEGQTAGKTDGQGYNQTAASENKEDPTRDQGDGTAWNNQNNNDPNNAVPGNADYDKDGSDKENSDREDSDGEDSDGRRQDDKEDDPIVNPNQKQYDPNDYDASTYDDASAKAFESAWGELAGYFQNIEIAEGSTVVTLSPNAALMPQRTLVEVLFVPNYHPSHHGGGSSGPSFSTTTAAAGEGPGTQTVPLTGIKSEDSSKEKGKGIKTGDETDTGVLLTLVMALFALAAGLFAHLKRRKADEEEN